MKKLIAVAVIGLSVAVKAQTVVPPNPIVPDPSTVTNGESFTNVTIEIWSGYAYTSGNTSASQARLGASYDLYKGFGVSAEVASQVTGNVITEMDAFFDYRKKINSIELIGGIGGGYNFDSRAMTIAAAFEFNYNLMKLGSTYMFVGVRDEIGFQFNSQRPANTTMAIVGDAF